MGPPPPPSPNSPIGRPLRPRKAPCKGGSGSQPRDAPAADTPCSHARGHAGAGCGSPTARAYVVCSRAGASAWARPPVADAIQGGAVKTASSAKYLVTGSTTSPVLAEAAGSELARPLESISVERFSRANHVFTCILKQYSILHRLFGCIRSVSGSAFYSVQGHSGNARVRTYADAQPARASPLVLSICRFCDFCTLH